MKWLALIAGWWLYSLAAPSAWPANPTDAETIIQNSVRANREDFNAAPKFDNCERDYQANGGSKTYWVMMIAGSPYRRLVAVNNKPLSSADQAQEQQKLEAAISQRRGESEQDRANRIAKYQADRKRDQALMDQLTQAFDFTLAGQRKLNGFTVYVLNATPRPGYRPPNTDTEVLKGMRGTLWIDQKSFQWVEVEAHVIQPVSIEGFLAQVQPGTRFELEKAPVTGDIWMPTHFAENARAKVLFLFGYKSQDIESYFNYRPADATNPNQSVSCVQ